MKTSVNEIKSTIYGFNSRIEEIEERMSDLVDKSFEVIQSDKNTSRHYGYQHIAQC